MKPPAFEFSVRKYRPSDLDAVLELVTELETELAEKFPDVQIVSGLDAYRDRYLKPGTKYETFVAEFEGRVMGFLIGYPSLGAPEVDNMYDVLPRTIPWAPPEFYIQITFVSPPHRNKGVSKALHRMVINLARERGFKEIYACIAKWNLPELAVIESCGFVRRDLGYRYRLSLKL
jgi:GNAT superfamily N-acetyltransferase